MSNLNKFYLSAVLIFAGIGMFFLVNHFLEKNTHTTIFLNPEASDSTIKAEITSGVKALASVPVEFSLEKHLNRQTEVQGKLMISSDATSVPFPQSEGDPYRWSPLEGHLILLHETQILNHSA